MNLSVGDWIAITSLTLNVLVALIGGTWGIAKVKEGVKDTFQTELDGHKDTTTKALESLTKLIADKELEMERKVGETGSAIREKIKEVELFTRDHFVRRDTFQEMVRIMTTSMQTQYENLQNTLNRLNDKLDRVIESRAIPPSL